MKPIDTTSWALPEPPQDFQEGEGRTPDDLKKWRELVARVAEVAGRSGWSKTDVGRRIGMPGSTFSMWYAGSYSGRLDTQNAKVENWLATVDEMAAIAATIPVSPAFVKTRFADEVTDMLATAQMMPAMVMVSAAAGHGKTMTANRYRDSHANVFMATLSPHTKTVHGMLSEIADAIEVAERNPGRLVRPIGKRLSRAGAGSLLIVDEAQNAVDDAINQLRHFLDNYGCGIALLGNEETYARFSGSWLEGNKYGQLRRRVFKRIRRTTPTKQDLTRFIKAWDIHDEKMTAFLLGVGQKPGAFGQIDMTVKLARMLAIGEQRPLTLDDLKAAWANRDVESV
ncbi:MAG: AAA family ATPase [Notoacmeibacter sp.]|nr:AAA family ATPase [Notoacmeibacter sp.]